MYKASRSAFCAYGSFFRAWRGICSVDRPRRVPSYCRAPRTPQFCPYGIPVSTRPSHEFRRIRSATIPPYRVHIEVALEQSARSDSVLQAAAYIRRIGISSPLHDGWRTTKRVSWRSGTQILGPRNDLVSTQAVRYTAVSALSVVAAAISLVTTCLLPVEQSPPGKRPIRHGNAEKVAKRFPPAACRNVEFKQILRSRMKIFPDRTHMPLHNTPQWFSASKSVRPKTFTRHHRYSKLASRGSDVNRARFQCSLQESSQSSRSRVVRMNFDFGSSMSSSRNRHAAGASTNPHLRHGGGMGGGYECT